MKYVVFDANAIPLKGTLHSPFLQAFFRVCAHLDYSPAIPEIVKSEVVNLRREKAREKLSIFKSAYRDLNQYLEMAEVYIPDEEVAADYMEASILERFEVLPLDGDAAIESLHREAKRQLPARGGRGGRDSSIWLTLVKLLEKGDTVAFISNNSQDFGKTSLHDSLLSEISDLPGKFEYFSDMNRFLADKSDRLDDFNFTPLHAEMAFYDSIIERLPDILRERFEHIGHSTLFSDGVSISVSESKWGQRFKVDETGIAHCSGEIQVSHSGDELFASRLKFQGIIVIDLTSGDVYSSEVESLDEIDQGGP